MLFCDFSDQTAGDFATLETVDSLSNFFEVDEGQRRF